MIDENIEKIGKAFSEAFKKESDNALYEKARKSVQIILGERCVRNKDVIIQQAKELEELRPLRNENISLRKEINYLKGKISSALYDNIFNIKINNDDYTIKYNDDLDVVKLNCYLIKIILEKDINSVNNEGSFIIENTTRKRECDGYFKM